MIHIVRRLATIGGLLMLALSACTLEGQGDNARIDVQMLFTASGWMGDGEFGRKFVQFSGADTTAPHSPPSAIKVTYSAGPNRWAGMYWQNEADNWGDRLGANYNGRGFSKITFWARGENGNEVVEFKAGGIDNRTKKYRDSFLVTAGRQTLTKDWKRYQMDLKNSSLSSVIGAFAWIVSADYNPGDHVTFFLDDIYIER